MARPISRIRSYSIALELTMKSTVPMDFWVRARPLISSRAFVDISPASHLFGVE